MAQYSTWINDNPDLVNAAAQRVGQQPALTVQQPPAATTQQPQAAQQPSGFNNAMQIAQTVANGQPQRPVAPPTLSASAYQSGVQSDAPRPLEMRPNRSVVSKVAEVFGAIMSMGGTKAMQQAQKK